MGGKRERGVLDVLRDTRAVITDSHIIYTSGKHGTVYINKDAVYPHTKEASRIGEMFAQKVKDLNVEVVAGPALGGIILSQWTAYHLSQMTGKDVLGIYTEKDQNGNQIFTRGYGTLVQGKNVLVVEDLTTTGGSVKKVVETVKQAGGNVVSVGVMVNRDPENVNEKTIGAPFFALGILRAEAFDQKDCKPCKDGTPINTEVGHGRKYLQELKNRQ